MTQTIEEQARNLGWVPQEEFRGDPARWSTAEAFVERGEQMMPLLKANNRKLQEQVSTLHGELQRVNGVIAASQEAIEELKNFHSEDTARKVEKARKDLISDLKQAKKDGDTDLEVDLQAELSQLDSAVKSAPAQKEPPTKTVGVRTPVVQPVNDPAFHAWQQQNPWFGQDRKKTALMVAAAEELRDDPKNATLVGPAFYKAAMDEVDKILGGPPSRSGSKVEASTGSHTSSSGGGRTRSFTDLPSDAKEACERQGKKLVGEGRAFKTDADWKKHYVEQYFLGE